VGLLDKFKKKKEEKEEKEEKETKGGFISFVLLSTQQWEKEKLAQELVKKWGFQIMEGKDKQEEDVLFLEKNGNMAFASYIPSPVPGEEAEYYASANYMWKDAVKTVKKHCAQVLIAVLGNDGDLCEKGRQLVQITGTMLNQQNAIAVYSDGAVYQPEFYQEMAALMTEENVVPVFNLVWFGICAPGTTQAGVYTYGMRKFGKDEMEVYTEKTKADFNKMRNFLSDIVSYVLCENVVLRDGETIGFSAEQKLAITKSKGIAVDGETLKIEYC